MPVLPENLTGGAPAGQAYPQLVSTSAIVTGAAVESRAAQIDLAEHAARIAALEGRASALRRPVIDADMRRRMDSATAP